MWHLETVSWSIMGKKYMKKFLFLENIRVMKGEGRAFWENITYSSIHLLSRIIIS